MKFLHIKSLVACLLILSSYLSAAAPEEPEKIQTGELFLRLHLFGPASRNPTAVKYYARELAKRKPVHEFETLKLLLKNLSSTIHSPKDQTAVEEANAAIIMAIEKINPTNPRLVRYIIEKFSSDLRLISNKFMSDEARLALTLLRKYRAEINDQLIPYLKSKKLTRRLAALFVLLEENNKDPQIDAALESAFKDVKATKSTLEKILPYLHFRQDIFKQKKALILDYFERLLQENEAKLNSFKMSIAFYLSLCSFSEITAELLGKNEMLAAKLTRLWQYMNKSPDPIIRGESSQVMKSLHMAKLGRWPIEEEHITSKREVDHILHFLEAMQWNETIINYGIVKLDAIVDNLKKCDDFDQKLLISEMSIKMPRSLLSDVITEVLKSQDQRLIANMKSIEMCEIILRQRKPELFKEENPSDDFI